MLNSLFLELFKELPELWTGAPKTKTYYWQAEAKGTNASDFITSTQ